MSDSGVVRSRSPRRGAARWREICEEYERFIVSGHFYDATPVEGPLYREPDDIRRQQGRAREGAAGSLNHKLVRGAGHPASRTSQNVRILLKVRNP